MTTETQNNARITALLCHRGANRKSCRKLQKFLHHYRVPSFDSNGKVSANRNRRLQILRDETEIASGHDLKDSIHALLTKSDYLLVICTPELSQPQTTENTDWARYEYERWKQWEVEGRVAQKRIMLLWLAGDSWRQIRPSWLQSPENRLTPPNFCRSWREARVHVGAYMAGLGPIDLPLLRNWHDRRRTRLRAGIAAFLAIVVGVISCFAISNYRLAGDLTVELSRSQSITHRILLTTYEQIQLLHGSESAVDDLLQFALEHLRELEDSERTISHREELARDRILTRLLFACMSHERGRDTDCIDFAKRASAESIEAENRWPGSAWPTMAKIQAQVICGHANLRLGLYAQAKECLDSASMEFARSEPTGTPSTVIAASLHDLSAWCAVPLENWELARKEWETAIALLETLPDRATSPDWTLVTCPSPERFLRTMLLCLADTESRFFYAGELEALERAMSNIYKMMGPLKSVLSISSADRPLLVEITKALTLEAHLREVLADRMKSLSLSMFFDGERTTPEKELAVAAERAAYAVEAGRSLVKLNPASKGFHRELLNALLVAGRVARDRGRTAQVADRLDEALAQWDLARTHLKSACELADALADEPGLIEAKGTRITARWLLAGVEALRSNYLKGEDRVNLLGEVLTLLDFTKELHQSDLVLSGSPSAQSFAAELEEYRLKVAATLTKLTRIQKPVEAEAPHR